MVEDLPAMKETWVQSLDLEDPLEKGMATQSSIPCWRIPWTEELGRLRSLGSQRVEHNWAINAFTFKNPFSSVQFSLLQSLSYILLLVTPWTAAGQASLSITNSWSSPKLMSIESVMPSNHLILCRPLLLLPSVFPSTRVFSNESAVCMRWPKYWSFSFNISPSNEYSGLISFRMDWLDLLESKGLSKVFSNTTVQKHQFFGAQLSL